jgi:uncharacterized Fe-S cluster protein YjdI
MDKKHITKTYSTDEVSVHWQSALCQHSGNCVKHLSSVFKPKEQPWIQLENSDTQSIIHAVSKCPSGALSIKKKED